MDDLDLVFWPAPVRKHPFEAHVRAAAAGGFRSLAIASTTVSDAHAGGLSISDMTSIATDRGIAIRHLDTLTTWAPNQLDPGNFDEEMNTRWNTPVERGLEICAQFGLTQILATGKRRLEAAYRPGPCYGRLPVLERELVST